MTAAFTRGLRTRRLRTRFLIGFGALLALATLNMGAFYWSARTRARVFHELRAAIVEHSLLTEIRAGIDDHYKRVKIVSDLLGVERAVLAPAEQARTLASLESIRHKSAAAARERGATPDAQLARVFARADSLMRSWARFYALQHHDPGKAIAEVVLTAEPLATELLSADLPVAVAAQQARVDAASADFVHADHASSALVWTILIVSGLVSIGVAFSLSRDLMRAIDALTTGVERFGTGELAYRITVTECDELAQVGESLNTMANRLHQARDELEERNQELAHLAFRDPLTMLANRALFRQRVEQALADPARVESDVFVLFVDLDDFKSVNDTMGHAAGDELLVDVSTRMLSATRGSDTVARLGGDEFAILLSQVRHVDEAIIVAERILASTRMPFAVGDRAVHVSLSIGIASGDGMRADELLRNADVAMYRAKGAGKGRYAMFVPAMHASLIDRMELEGALRDALDANEFRLAYQPLVELSTGRITAFEALARWRRPELGEVSPCVFIPLAEDTGEILPLGRWVLGQACRDAARWQPLSSDGQPLHVNVNVSGRQLDDPNFITDVHDALAAAGLPAHCLTLEITESVIMRDSASTLQRLLDLKAVGVRIAIDDFGTGYSSLAYLQRFPVDVLKIDKAFIDRVAHGGSDAAIARTIVTLGEMLQLRTVAEGIETSEQHDGLLALGCDIGQGYLYSRPVDGAAALRLLIEAREREAQLA